MKRLLIVLIAVFAVSCSAASILSPDTGTVAYRINGSAKYVVTQLTVSG